MLDDPNVTVTYVPGSGRRVERLALCELLPRKDQDQGGAWRLIITKGGLRGPDVNDSEVVAYKLPKHWYIEPSDPECRNDGGLMADPNEYRCIRDGHRRPRILIHRPFGDQEVSSMRLVRRFLLDHGWAGNQAFVAVIDRGQRSKRPIHRTSGYAVDSTDYMEEINAGNKAVTEAEAWLVANFGADWKQLDSSSFEDIEY